eukprot:4199207-Ditylum_brightwellii.AAC.1
MVESNMPPMSMRYYITQKDGPKWHISRTIFPKSHKIIKKNSTKSRDAPVLCKSSESDHDFSHKCNSMPTGTPH